jgi:hypothetical protein
LVVKGEDFYISQAYGKKEKRKEVGFRPYVCPIEYTEQGCCDQGYPEMDNRRYQMGKGFKQLALGIGKKESMYKNSGEQESYGCLYA